MVYNYNSSFLFLILIYLFLFNLLTFLYFYFISIEFYSLLDSTLSLAVINKARGKDGKFISMPSNNLEPLSPILKEALIGELLGDGCLRYSKKIQDGNPKPNWNVHFAMTLKSYAHVFYLWGNIFSSICTSTPPRPWPAESTGLPASQYAFSSKSLPELTAIHKEWYIWSFEFNKYIKIVPLNINTQLTKISLAHWLMGDGYWDTSNKTVVICTDNFTLKEVELLISVLSKNFGLSSTVLKRIKSNKEICWRIRFSSKSDNINKLISLVQPHFIPSMLYKLNMGEKQV